MELIIIGLGALMGWSILFPGWVQYPPFGEPDFPSAGATKQDALRTDKDLVEAFFAEIKAANRAPTTRTVRASTRALTDAERTEAAEAIRRAVRRTRP